MCKVKILYCTLSSVSNKLEFNFKRKQIGIFSVGGKCKQGFRSVSLHVYFLLYVVDKHCFPLIEYRRLFLAEEFTYKSTDVSLSERDLDFTYVRSLWHNMRYSLLIDSQLVENLWTLPYLEVPRTERYISIIYQVLTRIY